MESPRISRDTFAAVSRRKNSAGTENAREHKRARVNLARRARVRKRGVSVCKLNCADVGVKLKRTGKPVSLADDGTQLRT